jgi:hypothetical protein
MRILTPGSAAPLESVTVPTIEADSLWPNKTLPKKSSSMAA